MNDARRRFMLLGVCLRMCVCVFCAHRACSCVCFNLFDFRVLMRRGATRVACTFCLLVSAALIWQAGDDASCDCIGLDFRRRHDGRYRNAMLNIHLHVGCVHTGVSQSMK